jgi:hypothetical protein
MGLDYDPFNARINNKLYFQGRYLLGVGHSFIKFPVEVLQISLTQVKSRTKVIYINLDKDGLSLAVNMNLGLKLKDNFDDLINLYSKHGEVTKRNLFVRLTKKFITLWLRLQSVKFFRCL